MYCSSLENYLVSLDKKRKQFPWQLSKTSYLSSCRILRLPCLLSSVMGYVYRIPRPIKMRAMGAAETNSFKVRSTSLGWEQPLVMYPAKLKTDNKKKRKKNGYASETNLRSESTESEK